MINKYILKYLFSYLIFPGFLFVILVGMLASWLDRKITARLQWRVGPPLLQPFYDIRKLFVKEIILPNKEKNWIFIFAPLFALASSVLIGSMLIKISINPKEIFIGDIIVIIYLFLIPQVASLLGACASFNPLATLGAGREMNLILSYELPFIISILIPIIKAKSISIGEILLFQQHSGSFIGSIPGFLGFVITFICIQGKLGLVPFDLGEAETELASGSQIEYSGPLLAAWKLTKMVLTIDGLLFLVLIFWGKGEIITIIIKWFILLLLLILFKNINPRLRIDQVIRLFWGPVTGLALITLGLTIINI